MKRAMTLALALVVFPVSSSILVSQEPASKATIVQSTVQSAETEAIAMIRGNSDKLAASFNNGKVDEITSMFLSNGEMIDEAGTIYQGQQEIKNVLTELFKQFPGTVLTKNTESLRMVGPIVIEEGTRTMKAKDSASRSQFRYIAVWGKIDNAWKVASFRDIADDPAPTPNDFLQPLEWLVGDWVNQGADGNVAISYRWSEDKNYLLGEFKITSSTNASRTSSQRIGWDANSGRIRSWLFDADGGFSEGVWTVLEDSVVIKSTATNPDGSTASATLNLVKKSKDSFVFSGTDRIVGANREPDFELNVTRRSPAAKN